MATEVRSVVKKLAATKLPSVIEEVLYYILRNLLNSAQSCNLLVAHNVFEQVMLDPVREYIN